MSNPPTPAVAVESPFSAEEICRRLNACPKLPSLHSVNLALLKVVNAEESMSSQIAGVIRADPSLSSRLLRMVNCVYFGLSAHINSLEDAIFFLGLRRLRELALATPIIEELERLQSASIPPLLWKHLWAHSIGTATLARDLLLASAAAGDEDTHYLAGLLHNVGKIVMAHAFPDELMAVAGTPVATTADACALERRLIGWDHTQIGAYYLERHKLAEELVFAVRYHTEPNLAPCHHFFAAAVQLADHLTRHAGVQTGFENTEPVATDSWVNLSGWKILYGEDDEAGTQVVRTSLPRNFGRGRPSAAVVG
jgi:HD-like signal output (HDOD) protein